MPGIADNALVKAAPLITALGEYVPEQRLTPEVEALLEAVTGERPASPAEALERAREIGEFFAEMVEPLLSLTLAPTMITASQKRNVIPAICDVVVDSRLLPETTTAEQHAIVRSVLGDGDYELEWLEAHGGTSSPIESPLWDAVADWVSDVEPEREACADLRGRLHRQPLVPRGLRDRRLRVLPVARDGRRSSPPG